MMRLWLTLLALLWTLAAGAAEFLDPAVAFKPSVQALDARTLEVRFTIADGYYLYRDKFRFAVPGVRLAPPDIPRGQEKDDENFGKVAVFYRQAVIRLTLEQPAPTTFDLQITSQGCADGGLCYPPQQTTLPVELPDPGKTIASSPSAGGESGRITNALRQSGFWANLAVFFLAGLTLALTPCVYPMIPILSGIIAGQGHRASHARGLALSLAYVLGMASTYALAGIITGLTGTLISQLLQNAWVLGGFALIFVVLALSMFGFYELQLPSKLQSKLSEKAGHFSGGRGLGVFAMGALSALIVGPCVVAPLAGALLYIGQTGDALLGGAALFVMALGKGVPLIVVGTSTGALLPKAGPWMEAVKKAFGVVMLGTALWLVGPLLPVAVQMGAWAMLLIIPAIFLHALDPLPPHSKAWLRFWKGIGVVMLLTGAALLLGILSGARDPLQPLAGLRAASASPAVTLPFSRITSLAELESRLQTATQPVLLDFWADWCTECKRMERETLAHPSLQTYLAGFTLLQADVTDSTPEARALLARFGLFGPPAILFFDQQGQEIAGLRVVGFQDAVAFEKVLASAIARR